MTGTEHNGVLQPWVIERLKKARGEASDPEVKVELSDAINRFDILNYSLATQLERLQQREALHQAAQSTLDSVKEFQAATEVLQSANKSALDRLQDQITRKINQPSRAEIRVLLGTFLTRWGARREFARTEMAKPYSEDYVALVASLEAKGLLRQHDGVLELTGAGADALERHGGRFRRLVLESSRWMWSRFPDQVFGVLVGAALTSILAWIGGAFSAGAAP